MDLHEIFKEGWQWAGEQMIKFLVTIWVRDPYCNTGKTWRRYALSHCF